MASLRFVLLQQGFPTGAVDANAARLRAALERGAGAGAAAVLAPACALPGQRPQLLLQDADFVAAARQAWSALMQQAHTAAPALITALPAGLADGGGAPAEVQVLTAAGGAERQSAGIVLWHYADARIAVWSGAPALPDAATRAALAALEPDLVLLVAADAWHLGRRAAREAALAECARACGAPLIWLNAVGSSDETLYDGASLLLAADGGSVACGPEFADAVLACSFDVDSGTLRAEAWPAAATGEEVATLHAGLVRSIADYAAASGFAEALLGLSGGIDSALTLALATAALGAEHLHAVLLPSRYTSQLSLDLAQQQTTALGVACHELPIGVVDDAVRATLAPAFAGRAADTTEENIQARVRGVLLMALSNKFHALLLSTGNKSEEAVGYATLYGDMCGGFAPLKDVYKLRVYQLAEYCNRQARAAGRPEVIPQGVIDRAPSAELHAGQRDDDSLPPYAVLDDILERHLEGGASAADLVAAGHDPAIVARVLHLLRGAEFKRRQGAIGPLVTRRGFAGAGFVPVSSAWR